MPVQIFRTADTRLRKKKNGLRFLSMRKLVGTDCYLGIKLLIPKFWQNFMFIFIIALITALSYTGQSSMKLLNENNYNYYRDLMKGFDACGSIISEKELVPEDIIEMTEQFKAASIQCCTVMGEFYEYEEISESEDIAGFFATDTDTFMSEFEGKYLDNWKDIPIEQRMVVTGKTAEYMNYGPGDRVTINASWLGGKKEFIVVGITKSNFIWMGETDGIIVDVGNVIYTEKKPEGSYFPYGAYFYLNGEMNKIETAINQLESENRDFKGLIFEQIIEQGNTINMQRLAMIRLVMVVLIIVAGIGWLNSAKGLLLSRKNEYKILRMLGTTENRVKRICWIQILSYLLLGVIMGMIIGILSVYLIWKSNVYENVTISAYWGNVAGILLFLIIISLLLKPTVKKLAK